MQRAPGAGRPPHRRGSRYLGRVRVLALGIAIGCLVVTVGYASGASNGVTTCANRSVGPGALTRGGTGGAQCLLRAYQNGCRPASYRLSVFGVDTATIDEFRTMREGGRCFVAVTRSFHVIPRRAHVAAQGRCAAARRGDTDIVAERCVGTNLSATISLTGKS
jgi:hypothetical protein